MGHDHGHAAGTATGGRRRRLAVVLGLTVAVATAEVATSTRAPRQRATSDGGKSEATRRTRLVARLDRPWRTAAQRNGALGPSSARPTADSAPRAVCAHSASDSTRSPAGLDREKW